MATLPLKSSRNEQRAVIRFFVGNKDLMQMRFTLRCVQCMATSVLRDQQYMFGREGIVDKERPGRHVVATTDATIAAVDAFVRSDGTNVSTNLDDMLKNETLMFNI